MRKNNKFIIIISIILVLAIAGGVFAYLFLATDVFKSNREIFAKYFVQDLEKIEKILEFDTIKSYQKLNNEKKYESNTNVKLIHSEGGEVSNPLNNLSMGVDFQKDDEQQYFYGNGKISYENETYFAAELIKDKEQYGIRFPEVFKQFVTINQDEDIEALADDLGIDESILEKIIQIINGNEELVPEQRIKELKNKYLNIITSEISKGTFEKQKNAMITYKDVTTKTNAYSVSLTSEQVAKIIEEITETANKEIEISKVKITIYVANKQAIRTVFDIDENKITIENSQQEGKNKTIINYSNLSGEEAIECDLQIIKTNTENQENVEIIANVLQGENTYDGSFISKMQVEKDSMNLNIEMSYKKDITTISLILDNIVNIGSEFEKNQSLIEDNFKSLSSIKDETKRIQIINSLNQLVTQQTSEKVVLLMGKLMLEEDQENEQTEEENNDGITQEEINNFNAKFEFYAGEEVSSENVKVLLDIVKGNCSGHTITTEPSADTENENIETSNEEYKTTITLYIKEDSIKEESINKVLEKIHNNIKYKVLISYKDTNGLIDFITITEI